MTTVHQDPTREPRPGNADTSEALFGKLRNIFSGYGIRDFAVYVLDGEEAGLAFSCGSPRLLTSDGAARLLVAKFPGLARLLSGDAPLLLWGPYPGAPSAATVADQIPGVSLAFRVSFEGRPIGFILIYGALERAAVANDALHEMTSLVSLFSSTFAQHHIVARLRRDHKRVTSQLKEVRDSMGILLLRNRTQIFEAVLSRALAALGSSTGMIWTTHDGGWRCEHAQGIPPVDGMAAMERLVQRCLEQDRPILVSSISGEEISDFDIDTLHIASAIAFPLRSPTATIGCLVAFDATVSRDVASIVEGTALAGGVAIEAWRHSQALLHEHRLREQMVLAAEVQQRLLPAHGGQFRGLSVAHFSRYCEEAGGDYVDAIATHEPRDSVFTVGDVSGHGISAALLMVDVRARLRTHIETRRTWTPGELLTDLNRVLCSEIGAAEFVTLFLCTVDTRTGILRYANAGHEPPLLFQSRTGTWLTLPTTGLVLGVEAQAVYETQHVALAVGDILVVTTDGVTEALDVRGKPFGTESIQATVERHRTLEAPMLKDALVERTLAHCRGTTFSDDLTFLVLKINQTTLRTSDLCPPCSGELVLSERFASTRANKDAQLASLRGRLGGVLAVEEFNGVLMAIEEALSNAVIHGNRDDAARYVNLRLYRSAEMVSLVVENEGDEFDPFERVAGNADPEALNKASGRGLLIMASILDEVTYFNSGRGVCMVKRLGTSRGQ
jgi:serine phosphatase RsbU (regulator of sigma subunit)/anti-sigma regulatory factor (Ser/Thr protein kinase)